MNELVKKQDTQAINPMSLIQVALEKGVDPDKLYDLQERHEVNQAKKAFNHAMSEFAKNAPKLVKDRNVAFKQTKYRYVTLASIVNEVQKVMSELGLSHRWKTTQNDQMITVECIVTHEQGYSESSSFTAPPDNSGAKNSIQAIGSTISYGQRYTLLSILGLSAFEDDDARSAVNIEYITGSQIETINELLIKTDTKLGQFLKFLKVDSLEHVKVDNFVGAVNALETKIDKVAQ